MPQISFDTLTLKNLKPPPPGPEGQIKQIDYWDRTQAGFGLRVSSTGAMSWIIATPVLRGGRWVKTRHSLGRYSPKAKDPKGMTLNKARAKAVETKALCARGDDPKQAKLDAKQRLTRESEQTFNRVVDLFLAAREKDLRPATLRQYRDSLTGLDFAQWHSRPIDKITRDDVIDALEKIQARGVTVRANRALATVRAFFNWAVKNRHLKSAPPTDHVEAPVKETLRSRHLFGDEELKRPSEIALAWRAFDRCGSYAPFLKLMMLTGQRRNEVAGMSLDELIDLNGDNPRWHLQDHRTKNGLAHTLPLGPMAVAIIKAVVAERDAATPGGWRHLFVNQRGNPINVFSLIKRQVDAAVGALRAENPAAYENQLVTPWWFHDLRRTMFTGLIELGVSESLVDQLQNHVSGEARRGVRRHYNFAKLMPARREALILWEQRIQECIDRA